MKQKIWLEIVARATEIVILLLLAVPLYFCCQFLGDFSPLVLLVIFGIGYIMPWKE